MTENEIDAMEAGRELDALVAEQVMGWERDLNIPINPKYRGIKYWKSPTGMRADINLIPHYSTDIASAWEVVEKAHELTGCTISLHLFGTFERVSGMPKYMCKFYGGRIGHPTPELTTKAFGDTPMLAICRAALKTFLNR